MTVCIVIMMGSFKKCRLVNRISSRKNYAYTISYFCTSVYFAFNNTHPWEKEMCFPRLAFLWAPNAPIQVNLHLVALMDHAGRIQQWETHPQFHIFNNTLFPIIDPFSGRHTYAYIGREKKIRSDAGHLL